MSQLEIERVVARLVATLQTQRAVVVQAPPGVGKTTRLPIALYEHGLASHGTILVLEPRRLAARMAARRVAQMLGEPVGHTCGYQVRFETVGDARTRIWFMTEGMFARRLQSDPRLEGVALVMLDEFHERHLDSEIALAWTRRLRRERPELGLVLMSATIDGDDLATRIDAESLVLQTIQHPVEIEYLPQPSSKTLEGELSHAVRRVLERTPSGDMLAFLPGAREIHAAARACDALARLHDFDILPLHGELPTAEQDRAVLPASRRKLVLATNVAETSITIPGVVTVIDSGWARIPSHDAFSGLGTLKLSKIARDSAAQRAGRAGRTAPGTCLRLYTQADHDRRPARTVPEIERMDLTSMRLTLAALGVTPRTLTWLEAPPSAALDAAERLLTELGAIDDQGTLTPVGEQMQRHPLHPRLARVLVAAHQSGADELATTVVALLSDRPLRRHDSLGARHAAAADVLADAADLEACVAAGGASRAANFGLVASVVANVVRTRANLRRQLPRTHTAADDPDQAVRRALLAGFPDRVARVRREPGGTRTLALVGGTRAQLDEHSVVTDHELVLALSAERRNEGTTQRTVVRSAAALEPEWLLELCPEWLEDVTSVQFDVKTERVEATNELRYRGLVIERRRLQRVPDAACDALCSAALAVEPTRFTADPLALEVLTARTAFVGRHRPGFPVLTREVLQSVLAEMCHGRASFAELRQADLLTHALARLEPQQRAELERWAPERVHLPSGRSFTVRYELDRDPWLACRLQELFGCADGPKLLEGRVPIVLHLLAPNQRPVQVTTDLRSFWNTHYPEVRRALSRRYPKHAWPDDPWAAKPGARR